MPLSPGECLPSPLLRQFIDAVTNGAKLTILGGVFSLGKGGYGESVLNAILPVEPGTPWQVKRFPSPQPVRLGVGSLGGAAQDVPHVLWYHGVEVREGATVDMTAAGKPMFVSWPIGKGSVSVSLPCPTGKDWSKDQPPFWQSRTWREWMVRKALSAD